MLQPPKNALLTEDNGEVASQPSPGTVRIVQFGAEPNKPVKAGRITRTLVWGFYVVAAGLLIFAPGTLVDKLFFINSGICPQRPAHSYFIDGQQIPIEARKIGIYGGFAVTLLCLWLVGRGRAVQFPRLAVMLLLLGMIGTMAFDGGNATAYDFGFGGFYPPQNWLRLITGALSGIGIAGTILPMFSFVVWRRAYLTPTFRNFREVGLMLLPVAGLVLMVFSGWGIFFWVIALVSVLGVQAMLITFNAIVLVVVFRRENQFDTNFEGFTAFTVALAATLAELVLFATLRVSLGLKLL